MVRLQRLLQADAEGRRTLISTPGCLDALSALIIAKAGFDAAFLSGAGLSMARLG